MQTRDTKYGKIANLIAESIERGDYSVGDRLPSIRAISRFYSCSHMTAVRAIAHLEGIGLIENRPRSGTYVSEKNRSQKHSSEQPEPIRPPTRINDILENLLETESRPSIIKLGTAVRLDRYFPTAQILGNISLKSKQYQNLISSYSYPPGSLDLRTQIAKLLFARKIDASAEDLVLTSGETEAMFLALHTVCKPHDKVFVLSPCFFGTLNILQQLDFNIAEIPFGPIEGILSQIDNSEGFVALILQSNHNNPDGSNISDCDKQKLFDLCRQRSIYIFEDDTNGEIGHSMTKLSNMTAVDANKELVFSCGSFSKTLGPGFRIGWLLPPAKYLDQIKKNKLALSFSGVSVNERLIQMFLADGNKYERHLHRLNQAFKKNIAEITELFIKHVPGIQSISKPSGGFCIWIEFTKEIDSYDLYSILIQENIAISPGYIFSQTTSYKNFIRINCGLPSNRIIEESIKTIGKTVQGLLNLTNDVTMTKGQ